MSCPIEQHSLSTISRTLNNAYNLMLLCPRIEWYTLLASKVFMHKYVEIISEPFSRSVHSDGLNSFDNCRGSFWMRFWMSFRTARMTRRGSIVNICRNESRQTSHPKHISYISTVLNVTTFSRVCGILRKFLSLSFLCSSTPLTSKSSNSSIK
jgi:hypothetical protein